MRSTAQPQCSNTSVFPRLINLALLMTVLLSVALFGGLRMQAQTYKALHHFQGLDGVSPCSRLTGDANGHLYGTTAGGGMFSSGTAYEVKIATGRVTVLHDFTGNDDGGEPCGDLLRDPTGNLYGSESTWINGIETALIFKLDRNGALTVLHNFNIAEEGSKPSGLVADPAGTLYGTTNRGGPYGFGTVFKLDPNGVLTVLHSFSLQDGMHPYGGVLLHAGYLYGVTFFGGVFNEGTVYRVSVTGTGGKVLHSFNGTDGSGPRAGLARDSAGNLYGTTQGGGAFLNGTVFKLDRAGILTTLYSFAGGDDGWWPTTTLVLDAAGNLYGTTTNGWGTIPNGVGYGTLFKLDPAGVKTTLHTFAEQDSFPLTSLYMDAAGVLYGTSFNNFVNYGMIYSFTP